jgi:hypothetical protein
MEKVREITVKLVVTADTEEDWVLEHVAGEDMPDWMVSAEVRSKGRARKPTRAEAESMGWAEVEEPAQ